MGATEWRRLARTCRCGGLTRVVGVLLDLIAGISWADVGDLAGSPLVVAPLSAAVGVGAARVQRRSSRREEILNHAVASVSRLQAMRHTASGLEDLGHLTSEEQKLIGAQLREMSITQFVEAARDSRVALTAADPHVDGGLKKYWDKFELGMDERDEVVGILLEARDRSRPWPFRRGS